MSDYVTDRVESGQYGSASEYFRDLVRREQKRLAAAADLRRMLDEAESSGVSRRNVPDIVKQIESQLRSDGHL